ncbi:MAG: bi-domain-containing oxidoreductase [Syntrophaceae bacterium]|nr:bi-domain-containing oxidoreductase [Syntrophaceae bacterium]
MKQGLLKNGTVFPVDVPEPTVKAGFVKIRVLHSCISAGTEMSGVGESRKSLLKKALDNPSKITAAIDYFKDRGLKKIKDKLSAIADSYQESGYSIAGEIIETGNGVQNLAVGDRVAAGGMRLAVHAEYVVVPKNLVVRIPLGLDTLYASTATVGSIALHGVRRADLKLGEYGVVLGTGLLGLLATQIWKAAGIRIACIDLNDDRLQLAKDLGAEMIINPSLEDPVNAVRTWSAGHGADAVLFTATTSASEPLAQAFQMTRKKGRVVLVGVSGMNIKRKDIYSNEIDFLISTSYGPGRYDDSYELKGIDYPYPYVRWTENRNMGEFLRLIKDGFVNFVKLKPRVYPFDQISKAFADLEKNPAANILAIVEYDHQKQDKTRDDIRISTSAPACGKKGVIQIGLIGAGGFASNTLLPIIKELSAKFKLHTVVNRGGKKAFDVAHRFQALKASTDINDILENPEIDLVLIATRHGNHADLVLHALHAGKHVFVEKPLAVNQPQLDRIKDFYNDDPSSKKPLLMVGFNRRFSTYMCEVKRHVDKRINPLFMHYRMNAGYFPADSWVHEDGGRIVGEACHIIDLMLFLTGSRVREVQTGALAPANSAFQRGDNRSFTLSFADGSLAVIDYFAVGSKELPKEFLEVHFDGKSIIVDDYKKMNGFGLKVAGISSKFSQKGHIEEWQALAGTLLNGTGWPISLQDMLETTALSFLVNNS